jgi:hypothetical protein
LDDLVFPISMSGDSVSSNQPLYFLPLRTFSWACETCNSKKYIRCADNICSGRHEWDCPGCQAKGTVTCEKCAGQGRLDCSSCNGSNKVTCSSCGGDGKKVDKLDTVSAISSSTRSTRIVKKTCSSCSGKGMKTCSGCNNGKVTCSNCSGNGKITCSECDGMRKIKCSKCYGDKERYGLIDCPECKAMGEMAKISFVESIVGHKSISRIFNSDNSLKNITSETVMKFAKQDQSQATILKNYNDVFEQNYDDLIKNIIESVHIEFDFHLNGFENRVTREEVYYQVIPCVQVEYRHMISNAIHNVTILNYFENPELIIDNTSENEKSNSKDKIKVVGNFFGKLFKTSKYKVKEDKKKEIKMMILLAKIDGKIEDEEKIFLASQVSSLSDFSVAEKSEFFALMDSTITPQLTYKDIAFSSTDRFNSVIEILESLAGKDGDIDDSELQFIENLKILYAEGKKK